MPHVQLIRYAIFSNGYVLHTRGDHFKYGIWLRVVIGDADYSDRYHLASFKISAETRVRDFAKFANQQNGYTLVSSEIVPLVDTLL